MSREGACLDPLRACASGAGRLVLAVDVLPPRSSDASAARKQAAAPKVKAIVSPSANGFESRVGKKVRPVIAAADACGSAERTWPPSRRAIGL